MEKKAPISIFTFIAPIFQKFSVGGACPQTPLKGHFAYCVHAPQVVLLNPSTTSATVQVNVQTKL